MCQPSPDPRSSRDAERHRGGRDLTLLRPTSPPAQGPPCTRCWTTCLAAEHLSCTPLQRRAPPRVQTPALCTAGDPGLPGHTWVIACVVFSLTGLEGPGLRAPKTCSEVAVCPGLTREQRAGGSRTTEPDWRPAGLAGLRDSSAREQRGPRPRDPQTRPQRLGAGEPCKPRVDGFHCFLLPLCLFLTTSTSRSCQTRK